jgi:hypothetical protein
MWVPPLSMGDSAAGAGERRGAFATEGAAGHDNDYLRGNSLPE